MTKRTRLFFFVAAGILVTGLGTGLVASYMGVQNLVLIGGDGPAELAYVPSDSRVVAFANVREVMDSELRQKLMQLEPNSAQGADEFLKQTGVDLRTEVDQVIASLSGDATPQNARPLLLVRGSFSVAAIESLIREKGGVVEQYQGKRMLTQPQGEMAVAFVEPGLIAVGTASSVRRALDTKVAGTDITDNDEVMRLIKGIDDGNAWAVARFDALAGGGPIPSDLAKQLPAINWFSASSTINGGISAVLHAETRDEAAANDLREVIRGFVALGRMQVGQRPEFADLINSIELSGEGKTVSLAFSVPPEMIDAIGAMHALRPRQGIEVEPKPEVGPTLREWPAL